MPRARVPACWKHIYAIRRCLARRIHDRGHASLKDAPRVAWSTRRPDLHPSLCGAWPRHVGVDAHPRRPWACCSTRRCTTSSSTATRASTAQASLALERHCMSGARLEVGYSKGKRRTGTCTTHPCASPAYPRRAQPVRPRRGMHSRSTPRPGMCALITFKNPPSLPHPSSPSLALSLSHSRARALSLFSLSLSSLSLLSLFSLSVSRALTYMCVRVCHVALGAGCLIGCLRKIQHWSHIAICEE